MSETIVSTKEQVGTYDAIETAKPGEPLFPLQGGDPLAPLCVMVWAWKARKLARTLDEDDKQRVKLLRKASAAEEVAWAMKAYQQGEAGGDVADVPEPTAGYNGIAPEKHGDWLPGIVAGVKHLAEAAAAFNDAAEHLPEDQGRALLAVIEALKSASAKYQPKRASYPKTPDFPTA